MRFPQASYTAEDYLERAYPLGYLYLSVIATNPAIQLGIGIWQSVGAGRVLVGFDSGDSDFDASEKTGGAKTITLTESQLPAHTHVQNSHNHTQDAHTHTQDAHTHTQNAHNHTQRHFPTATGGSTGQTIDTSMSGTQTNSGLTTADSTAVNQNTTATNQNTIATNQATTAVNQNTGGGAAHSNLQPFLVVYIWKRIG